MKRTVFFAALLFAALAHGQTPAPDITYHIEPCSKDSFFLVETMTMPPAAGSPRSQVTITPQFFRSPSDFEAFIKSLLDEAARQKAEAQKLIRAAENLEKMAAHIEEAGHDHRAFLGWQERKKQKKTK